MKGGGVVGSPRRAWVALACAGLACGPVPEDGPPATPIAQHGEAANAIAIAAATSTATSTATSSPLSNPGPASLPSGVDASYTLELVSEPFPYVVVTFVTHGTPGGTTHLRLGEWGGIEHPESEVHALTVTAEDGRRLAIEHAEGALWTVRHRSGALLTVRYALVSTQYDVGYGSESYYRPLLTPRLFHIIGNTALLHVGDEAGGVAQHFAFRWKGFKEVGWKVASSFSVEQDGFDVNVAPDDFRQAVFLAGDLRLVRRDVYGGPLWLAIAGTDWGFFDKAFADTAAKIVAAQRGFFEDHDWPFFLVSVIPVGQYSPGSYSQGGTGLTHSFALFLTPRTDLGVRADGTGVAWLLSHELFHLWNGHRYRLADPEALGYWFSEGFTNFYARRLLRRAGLIDTPAFVANLNDEVERYVLSPVKSEPAARIAKDFWKNRDIEKLPYLRGDVVALLTDAEIRAVSHGRKSLDDLMKELLAKPREPPPSVTSETFLALIASYTSDEFADRIRKVVVDGAPLVLDPRMLEPCLHGRLEPLGPYDLGFDEPAARARHLVQGVAPGSNAYRAGLRDGQKMVSWKTHRNDIRTPVEVVVEEAGATRSLSYVPQGKTVSVPQFSADAELPAACAKAI